MQRPRISWLAGSLALAACGILAHPAPAAAPVLKVRKQLLKPNSVPGSGGDVTVKATITKPGFKIQQVQARAQIGTQNAGVATTLKGKGSSYSGTVHVPANQNTTPGSAAIIFYVTTAQGTESVTFGTVSVGAGSDTGPPAPPPN